MIQWRQIEEAPDYWISNRGEVLSKRVEGKEKIITPHCNPTTGYMQVSLIISDKSDVRKTKTFYPHQLVALYFCERKDGHNRVHHKDHQKTNNHYWNLSWVSQETNIWEYYQSAEKNKPRNMKEIEVWTTKGDYIATYPSINKAAKEMKVSPTTVWRQARGDYKSSMKIMFKYKEE